MTLHKTMFAVNTTKAPRLKKYVKVYSHFLTVMLETLLSMEMSAIGMQLFY